MSAPVLIVAAGVAVLILALIVLMQWVGSRLWPMANPSEDAKVCLTCSSDDPAVQRVRGPGQRHCPDEFHSGGK